MAKNLVKLRICVFYTGNRFKVRLVNDTESESSFNLVLKHEEEEEEGGILKI